MSPLVIVCLILLVLLFVGDLLLRAVAPSVAAKWSWKARPVLHAIVAVVLVALVVLFGTLKI